MTALPAEKLPPAELLHVLARTLPALWHSAPTLLSLYLLMQLLSGLTPALAVLLGKWTVDGLIHAAQGRPANLTLLVLAWTGTALLAQATSVAASLVQGRMADHFTVSTVLGVMDKMAQLVGLDVLEDPQFHDDIEAVRTGAPNRPLNLLVASGHIVQNLVASAGLALTLLSLGWWVPFVVVAGLVPLTLNRLKMYRAGWSFTIQRTQQSREINYDLQVSTRHDLAAEVRLYHLLPWLRGRYHRAAEAYQRDLRAVRTGILLGALPGQLLALGVTAGVFALTVWRAERGLVTAGTVVLAVSALSQLRGTLQDVSEMFGANAQHLSWFAKYHDLLAAVPGVAAPACPQPLPEHAALVLEDVTFRYPDGRTALEHVSLRIPHGQTLAVVGENGAGKSTLARLLLRLYDPSEGRVTVGGADLRELDPAAWRARVAAVFQDFARFDYTIRENVLLGRPLDAAQLERAVRESGLDAVLARLPQGLDTRLGSAFGGSNLSGGQWQRLATARALYRLGPQQDGLDLLILDEPTAALDPRSEREVFDSFARLARGRNGQDGAGQDGNGQSSAGRPTTLLITHRLGSVTLADRVVVMRAGKIVEDGTHAELLACGGEYAELWRLQAGQYGGEVGG